MGIVTDTGVVKKGGFMQIELLWKALPVRPG